MNSSMVNWNRRNQVWSVTQKVQTYNSTTSKRNVSVGQRCASTNNRRNSLIPLMAGPTAQAVSSTGSNGVVLIRLESELNPTLCI